MKKFLTMVAVLLASATLAHAQFGVIGGINISGTKLDTKNIWNNAKNVTLYHVGVAYQIDMAMGFSVQPSLTYEMKGANLESTTSVAGWTLADLDINTKSGYLELGAALQWGPDLIVARPFVFLQPYLGYQVVARDVSAASALNGAVSTNQSAYEALNAAKSKLEYGFGIGAGVEFLKHLQLSVQYFKNLGNLYNDQGDLSSVEWDAVKDLKSYGGVKVSLGIFF